MSTAPSLFTADQFQCSICLEDFIELVSIPCGHNYCKACITVSWDKSGLAQCPICRETFNRSLALRVITGLKDLVEQFKLTRAADEADRAPARPGEVPCDVCPGMKLKALKSCLVCLASYCQVHLEPHERVQALKRHKLIDPMGNLDDRVCQKHDKALEFYYRVDQMCVCVMCLHSNHLTHETVSLEQEITARKALIGSMSAEVKQRMQHKRLEVEQINVLVRQSREDFKKVLTDFAEVFSAMIAFITASHAELANAVEGQQKALEEKAEGYIRYLQREIELEIELQHLSNTTDDIRLLLQNPFIPSLPIPPPTRDLSRLLLQRDRITEAVRRSVSQLEETFSDVKKTAVRDLMLSGSTPGADAAQTSVRGKTEEPWNDQLTLTLIRQLYAVDVTLDSDTAHPVLMLSKDEKQVWDGGVFRKVPYNMKRYYRYQYIAGKEGYSSRFYYEVQVCSLKSWVVGVVNESIIGSEGNVSLGQSRWTLCLNNRVYQAVSEHAQEIQLKMKPQKVGVFVDYEGKRVSFYNVDSNTLIHTFTNSKFEGVSSRLFPIFFVRREANKKGSPPLIITPVKEEKLKKGKK